MKRARSEDDDSTESAEMSGLVNPLEDGSTEDNKTIHTSVFTEQIRPLSLIWAKVTGFKPAWCPAVICYECEGHFMVYFLEGLARPVPSSENKENEQEAIQAVKPESPANLPSWYIEELSMRIEPGDTPTAAKYAWVLPECVELWGTSSPNHASHLERALKAPEPKRRNQLKMAIEYADDIHFRRSSIPAFIGKEARAREFSHTHAISQLAMIRSIRNALKMQHLKLFLESNMMELHWRTIAYARQFVRAVKDEIFGGYHLIATQDWPTDKEIDSGGVSDVFLVYPGSILTESEAKTLENSCRSGIHDDPNRYVAEIPNTDVILDKSKKHNVNFTRKNLYVDGLKYSNPEDPCWAPGPTANHERVAYCKLAPHHVVDTGSIRGFWLQRKRGEIILKGEPLFWSYDCGAGKFDADFGLTNDTPPPIGWIPTAEIIKHRGVKK
jgi:hypothetical protein